MMLVSPTNSIGKILPPSISTSFLQIIVDDRAVNHTFDEVRSFHSSQCICDLGTKEAVLCSLKSCGICQITKSRFKSFAFGVLYNSGRSVVDWFLKRKPNSPDGKSASETAFIRTGIQLWRISFRHLVYRHPIV
jgi:hypothetical protein